MTKSESRLLTLLFSMIFAMVLAAVAFRNNMGADATKDSLIWTGRAAFFIFLIPFFASPLRALFKNQFTARLLRLRRNSGIAYGGMQVIHIFLIAWYFKISATQPVDDDMLYIGGFGIALVVGMLVTSFDGPTKAIGRKGWKILHKSGFYICSFIYFYDFVIEPIELGKTWEYAPFGIITLIAMFLRTVVWIKPKLIKKNVTA